MLSSTLIGCFTVRLNVELYSDWLFHSVAHFSSLHGRKETQGDIYIYIYIYIYISILSHAVKLLGNYTVNKMRALGSRY